MNEARDTGFMRAALHAAQGAAAAGEAPIGAVVVDPATDAIIAAAGNAPISTHDPSGHAEIRAMRMAAEKLGNYRLTGLELYVTLEPCAMCAGAIVLARIPRLVYGAEDAKGGACGSLRNVVEDPRLNHRCEVRGGVLARQCADVLKDFFAALRSVR